MPLATTTNSTIVTVAESHTATSSSASNPSSSNSSDSRISSSYVIRPCSGACMLICEFEALVLAEA